MKNTQQKLFTAAIKVFAEKGFRDATVRQICKLAGTANINAVNYYFGSKEQLYKSILVLIFEEYDKQIPKDYPDKAPEEQLAILISTFCRILYKETDSAPGITTILVQELSRPSPFLEDMVETFKRPRVKAHIKMFKRLLGKGATDDMARDCMVSVSGQIIYYCFAQSSFAKLYPDYFTGNFYEKWAAHVYQFTLGGIEVYKRQLGNS